MRERLGVEETGQWERDKERGEGAEERGEMTRGKKKKRDDEEGETRRRQRDDDEVETRRGEIMMKGMRGEVEKRVRGE